MRKRIKTCFQPLQTLKKVFFKDLILVVWKYVQMHKNTFLTTPDVKNFFKDLILVVRKCNKIHC